MQGLKLLGQQLAKIWQQLGQLRPLAQLQLDDLTWGELEAGTAVGPAEAIFPRLQKEEAIDDADVGANKQ